MLRILILAVFVLRFAESASATAAVQVTEPGVDLVIASGVEDREPVDPRTSFPANTETVTAWARVAGLSGTTVTFVWEYGENLDTINVEIGGSPWRTWTEKTIPNGWTGEWTVTVTGTSGALASETFTVEPD